MNYAEYRENKTTFLKSDPFRLDCMNVWKSLGNHIPERGDACHVPANKVFAEALGLSAYESFSSSGVRNSLSSLFNSFKQEGRSLIIPKDVYPVYQKIVGDYFNFVEYKTIPKLELRFDGDTLLLTLPFSPTGSMLSEREIDAIVRWLNDDYSRICVVDAVYSFSQFSDVYRRLLDTKQCICLFSMSKGWLTEGRLGVAISATRRYRYRLGSFEPDSEVVSILSNNLGLPQEIQSLFDKEWERLSDTIRQIDKKWTPPLAGYYSILDIPFEDLLSKHNILGVPTSVFGSKHPSTAISCLFDVDG